MTQTYIKRNHGFFIVGRVLAIIEYVVALVALIAVGVVYVVTPTVVLEIIKSAGETITADVEHYVTVGCLVVGIICLASVLPTAIVGGIALKKIGNAKTKEDLLPWAIVTFIFINEIAGILLILASTLPCCRDVIVERAE